MTADVLVERDGPTAILMSRDFHEGVRAFLEKRRARVAGTLTSYRFSLT